MNSPEFLGELLQRAGNGDRAAFSLLYGETSSRLYALCLRILRREELAEDALQEAFISIWRNAPRYDESRAAPMTWMGTIARNRALDMYRRKRPASENDEALYSMSSDDPGPLEETMRLADSSALSTCMQTLSLDQRRAVLLAFLDGRTHDEVSDALSRPLGTVKSWIRRGLDQLRRCLEGER